MIHNHRLKLSKIIRYVIVAMLLKSNIVAQNYFGAGIHLAPPVSIDYCCNPYVHVKPMVSPAYSLSYKKEWESKNKKSWYAELGFSTIGLGFRKTSYFGDSVVVWGESNVIHTGSPTVFFNSGRTFTLNENSGQKITVGLEGAYRIAHDLGGYFSSEFGLDYSTSDLTFPLFLRLHAGYSFPLKFLKRIPVNLQLYTKVSAQNIAASPLYLVNLFTGEQKEGKYRLNNSEIGFKLYTDLNKKRNQISLGKEERKTRKIKAEKRKYRFSLEGQYYIPPATRYFIPQLRDSFTLTGLRFSLSWQAGVKMEILHRKNQKWAIVFGLGLGQTTYNGRFIAQAEFTRDGKLIEVHQGGYVGLHATGNAGFSYRHPAGKWQIQHTLSSTFVAPLTKEDELILAVERAYLTLPVHLVPKILEGNIHYKYGRESVLFGLEYQPEIVFHSEKKLFYAIGLVFNTSYGIITQGRVKVSNGHTDYFGELTQRFSKIGLTLRVGINSNSNQ